MNDFPLWEFIPEGGVVTIIGKWYHSRAIKRNAESFNVGSTTILLFVKSFDELIVILSNRFLLCHVNLPEAPKRPLIESGYDSSLLYFGTRPGHMRNIEGRGCAPCMGKQEIGQLLFARSQTPV